MSVNGEPDKLEGTNHVGLFGSDSDDDGDAQGAPAPTSGASSRPAGAAQGAASGTAAAAAASAALDANKDLVGDMSSEGEGGGQDGRDPSGLHAELFGADESDAASLSDGIIGRPARAPPAARPEAVLPRLPRVPPATKMAFVTLPKVLGACPQGFDPAHYDFDAEREELAAQDKLVRLDNMIRWRYKTRADGTPVLDAQGRKVRESNSRLVQWSDGTMQLQVGREYFDVTTAVLPQDKACLYINEVATIEGRQETVLECYGAVQHRLTFHPHSLNSQAHRALSKTMQQQMARTQKVKMIAATGNPEKERKEREREFNKQAQQLARAKQRMASSAAPRQGGLSAGFLEADEYNEAEDIGALKALHGKKRKRGSAAHASPSRRVAARRGRALADDSEADEEDMFDEEEEDEEEEEEGEGGGAEMEGFIAPEGSVSAESDQELETGRGRLRAAAGAEEGGGEEEEAVASGGGSDSEGSAPMVVRAKRRRAVASDSDEEGDNE